MSPSEEGPALVVLGCLSPPAAGAQLSVNEDGPQRPVEADPPASPPKDKLLRLASKPPASFDVPVPVAVPKRLSNILESSVGGGKDDER